VEGAIQTPISLGAVRNHFCIADSAFFIIPTSSRFASQRKTLDLAIDGQGQFFWLLIRCFDKQCFFLLAFCTNTNTLLRFFGGVSRALILMRVLHALAAGLLLYA